jgi:hypothetical protein
VSDDPIGGGSAGGDHALTALRQAAEPAAGPAAEPAAGSATGECIAHLADLGECMRGEQAARDHLVRVVAALTAAEPDVAMKQLHNVRC